MNFCFKTLLLVAVLLSSLEVEAQDSLILISGRRIAYQQLNEYSDTIEIRTPDKEDLYFAPDSVIGHSEILKEKRYFLKPNPDPEEDQSYVFVERLISGKVSLFERTKGTDAIYVEKGGRFENIFDPIERGEAKNDRMKVFASFFEDDMESTSYIQNPSFDYKFKEIVTVVEYYNQRNFEERTPNPDDVRGKVFLYRTKFQKTKAGIKIQYYGGDHDLYIEDFIHLDLPVNYPSKLIVYDDFYTTEILLSGEFEDQFYEVLYDKKTNGFVLDQKQGTELYMEIVKIREKVDKRID